MSAFDIDIRKPMSRQDAIDRAVRQVWEASSSIGRSLMVDMAKDRDCDGFGVFAANLRKLVGGNFRKIMAGNA